MSSSITARHRPVVSVLASSLVLLVATACEPLSCQGRVDTIGGIATEDVVVVQKFCKNNEVIFNGDIDVTNQATLDAITGCTEINGSILIHDSDDIVNLDALAAVREVKVGYIMAINNSALTSINLPALVRLENGFAAIDNPLLTEVLVPTLPLLGGDLTLRNSPLLTRVDFKTVARIDNADFLINGVAFNNVTFGNIILAELPALTTLNGAFTALEVIEGFLDVHGTGLTSFAGFGALREIRNTGGAATLRTKFRADGLNPGLIVGIDFNDKLDIVPAGNPALADFAGLDNLDSIAGDVFVGFNDALENFEGLDDITTIDGDFFVVGNAALTSFSGFTGDGNGDGDGDGLTAITGSLNIGFYVDHLNQPVVAGNPELENLKGLERLTTLGGNLVLAFADGLDDLDGLDTLPTIGGDFAVIGGDLRSLDGATALTTITGNLSFGQVFGKDGLPIRPDETDPTRQLKDAAGVPQDPGVTFDPGTNGENGFDALTTVGGDLVFAFSALDGLRLTQNDTLTTVNGSLVLYGNNDPDTLTGLESLTNLGGLVVNFAIDAFGDLHGIENDGLSDFSQLGATDLGAGGLHIGLNADLDAAAFSTFNDFGTVAGSVTVARVVDNTNVGPASLADLNIGAIGGDLSVCAIRNGDDAPIDGNFSTLTALDLDATANVGGDVLVAFCSALTNTSSSVQNVGGVLEFTALPALGTLNGLNQLNSVGSLLLHDLDDLEAVSIPALATVNGNLEVVRNAQLETIDFALNSVDGTIRFVDLQRLPNLNGLAGLNTVGADLDLIDLPAVETTSALDSLDSVTGTLRLRRLDNVDNDAEAGGEQGLSFAQLNTVGSIEVSQMNGLADLAGLQALSTVTDAVLVLANPNLETLFGLQGLTSVGRKLAINDNPVLELAFFDDDNQDRVKDFDNNNGVNNEPEDPDNIFESGIVALTTLGSPVNDGAVIIGGSTGVIELRNNPLLDETDFFDEVVEDLINNYEGLVLFCGNGTPIGADDPAKRLTASVDCGG